MQSNKKNNVYLAEPTNGLGSQHGTANVAFARALNVMPMLDNVLITAAIIAGISH